MPWLCFAQIPTCPIVFEIPWQFVDSRSCSALCLFPSIALHSIVVCLYGLCSGTQSQNRVQLHSSGSIDCQLQTIATHEEMPKCGPDDDIAFTLSILGAGFSCKPWPQPYPEPNCLQKQVSVSAFKFTFTLKTQRNYLDVIGLDWTVKSRSEQTGLGSLVCCSLFFLV